MKNDDLIFSKRELDLIVETLDYYLSEAEISDENLYAEIERLTKRLTKETIR